MADTDPTITRLQRLERLAELVPAIAGALDVREVFNLVSEVTRRVLPHDLMGLVLVEPDGVHARLFAVSAGIDFQRPDRVVISPGEQRLLAQQVPFEIVDDIQQDPVWRARPPGQAGYRGLMRVPFRLPDGQTGGVSVVSRRAAAFTVDDVPVLQRVAAYVSLALSHQRLAEQAAREAEARERALRLERRVEVLSRELASLSVPQHRILGRSPAWQRVLADAARVARTDATVLLSGESGTGKELIARLIHRESARAAGPFVPINCAAIPEALVESELFGVERGAFTGAVAAREGRIEQAHGGTLLLDEISELGLGVQAKLLRVLQEREVQRLGATRARRVDVRLLVASNRPLRRQVELGRFREDLFYRLHVIEICLPPLRERPEDILLMAGVFLEDVARQLGRPVSGLSADARPALLAHGWPGNVRELRNAIERAVILADGGLVTAAGLALPPAGSPSPATAPTAEASSPTASASLPRGAIRDLRSLEREEIVRALEACHYNKAAAARRLGLSRTQLYVRLRRHGLDWAKD